MDFTAGEKIARRHWLYKWRQIIVKNFAKSVRYSCARWEPRGGGGRGINCAQRVIYQFPRGSSLLFTAMIPIRGIVVRIFWRRTLTPTEGWEGDRTRRVRGARVRQGGREVDAIYASELYRRSKSFHWRHVLQARAHHQLFSDICAYAPCWKLCEKLWRMCVAR